MIEKNQWSERKRSKSLAVKCKKMLFRIQSSLNLCLHRIPVVFSNRIYASSTAPDWKNEKKAKEDEKNDNDEEASISSMIGPYISSKQIAFHTGQFDSEQIGKKNKQAFLVCLCSIEIFR